MSAIPIQDELGKRRALRRMRGVALGLLLVAVLVYVLARKFEADQGAAIWGYVRAAAEAGVVGGLADWFAVTALFKHPLGIPIPHTALIKQKKDQLGESLSNFVHGNFMSPANVAEKVESARPAQRLGEYLENPDHRRWLVAQGAGLAEELLNNLDDAEIQLLVRNAVFTQLSVNAWAPPAGRLLHAAVDGGNHTGVVDGLLDALHYWLLSNREQVAFLIADRGPVSQDGPIRWLHERIGYKGVDLLIQWVQDLREDPQAPARQQLDRYLLDLAEQLQQDPRRIEQVEQWKTKVLYHEQTQRTVNAIWPTARDLLTESLRDPDSDLRQRAEDYLAATAVRLRDDPDFRADIDRRISGAAAFLVDRYGADAANVIAETVKRWDADEASRKIELAVGKDLQYIRINGTIVGALAGLAIYSLSELIL
ncbi:MAG: DUF445 domain-containing protein [Actinobacteria bacterium]|nr:DUF445 domain-containing protein [Actinomycetota bacterium]